MGEAALFHSSCPQHLAQSLHVVDSHYLSFKEIKEELTSLAPEKPGSPGVCGSLKGMSGNRLISLSLYCMRH